MHSFLLKSTLVLNSALPFWKLLVSEFLLGIAETAFFSICSSCKNYTYVRCASAANVVCKEVDIFGAGNVHINNFYIIVTDFVKASLGALAPALCNNSGYVVLADV
jgi:hypothetical protein